MSLLSRLRDTLFRRDRLAQDLADEMAFHREMRTQDNVAAGMAPEAAADDAARRFGHGGRLHEAARDVHVIAWLDALVREAGQARRGLLRRPGLVVTAVLSLAVGIGATSAIFSVVDAVLLRPLPLPEADAVVLLREFRGGGGMGGNAARFRDWQQDLRGVEDLSGWYGESVTLQDRGQPERFAILRTFGPALRLLGARVAAGRTFSDEEERGAGAPVVLMSHGLWQRRYGGDAAIVGRTLTLGSTSYTVIGILAREFGYPEGQDFVSPAPAGFQEGGRRGGNYFTMAGRLAAGTSLAAAGQEVAAIARRFGERYPDSDAGITATVTPLQEVETAEARTPLLALLAAVGLVLVIACVNIAGLLLTRAAERRHEAAIRVALGAGRASLLRLYLLESGWLALVGGLGGLLVAWLGLPLLLRLLPPELPQLGRVALDWRVALFALAVSVGAGLLVGLAPAWLAARQPSMGALRDGGRTATGSRRVGQRLLVVVQVALSMMLLVGAGLFARSLWAMRNVPVGVQPEQVLAVRLQFPWDTDQQQLHAFYRRALAELREVPGVQAAGLADRLPLDGGSQSRPLRLENPGAGPGVPKPDESISLRAVSEDYFATVSAPLRAGRAWRDDQVVAGYHEVVVNEAFVRQYLPAGGALGARLTFDVEPAPGQVVQYFEVVGVVADIRPELSPAPAPPEVYLSYLHTYWPLASFVLRVHGEPSAMAAAVRDALRRVDPGLVVDRVAPLTSELARPGAASRVRTGLIGAFALAALFLAALGLYGVLVSDVTQRRQEIGVRLALGADPGQVRRMVVGRGLRVTLAGLAVGTLGALALGRVVASLLFGIRATDLAAYAVAGLTLLGVALLASYLPARRAAGVEPAVVLRRE